MRPPRGRGGGHRGGRGGGFKGERGGGRSGGGDGDAKEDKYDKPTPVRVVEVSEFIHPCENNAVMKLTTDRIPKFNSYIYLQNKVAVGKVDEIFGPINESCFAMRMRPGNIATSYAAGDKFFIDPYDLLPMAIFLPQSKGAQTGGRGGPRGGRRGGGPSRGGRGPFRGKGAPGGNRGGRGGDFRGNSRAGGGGRGGDGGDRGRGGFSRGRGRGRGRF